MRSTRRWRWCAGPTSCAASSACRKPTSWLPTRKARCWPDVYDVYKVWAGAPVAKTTVLLRHDVGIAAGGAGRRNHRRRRGAGIGRPDLHLGIDVRIGRDDAARLVQLVARVAARRRRRLPRLRPRWAGGAGEQQKTRGSGDAERAGHDHGPPLANTHLRLRVFFPLTLARAPEAGSRCVTLKNPP